MRRDSWRDVPFIRAYDIASLSVEEVGVTQGGGVTLVCRVYLPKAGRAMSKRPAQPSDDEECAHIERSLSTESTITELDSRILAEVGAPPVHRGGADPPARGGLQKPSAPLTTGPICSFPTPRSPCSSKTTSFTSSLGCTSPYGTTTPWTTGSVRV